MEKIYVDMFDGIKHNIPLDKYTKYKIILDLHQKPVEFIGQHVNGCLVSYSNTGHAIILDYKGENRYINYFEPDSEIPTLAEYSMFKMFWAWYKEMDMRWKLMWQKPNDQQHVIIGKRFDA